MDFEQTNLEILFGRLRHDDTADTTSMTSLLHEACAEYSMGLAGLHREERMKVNFIKALLEYCEVKRWNAARNLLQPAEEEYMRFFDRYLRQARRNHGETEAHEKGPGSNSATERSRSQQGARPPSNIGTPRPNSHHTRSPRKREGAGTVTDMSDLSSPDRLVAAYGSVFRHEWCDAMDELEQLRVSEPRSAGCLLAILLEAYKVSAVEAETQIAKLEEAARGILLDVPHQHMGKFNNHRRLLEEYRRGMAEICVNRLIDTFNLRYLPELIRGVGVYQSMRTHGPIFRYAGACVTLSWAMAVADPRVHMVDDRGSAPARLDPEVYNTFTRGGPLVDYYVWPPLRREKGGPLLVKGVAQGR